MSYDNWKTTNPEDSILEPADLDVDDGEVPLDDEFVGSEPQQHPPFVSGQSGGDFLDIIYGHVGAFWSLF